MSFGQKLIKHPYLCDNLAHGLDDGIGRIVQEVTGARANRDLSSPRGQSGEIALRVGPRLKEFGWRGDVPGTEHEQRTAAETPGYPPSAELSRQEAISCMRALIALEEWVRNQMVFHSAAVSPLGGAAFVRVPQAWQAVFKESAEREKGAWQTLRWAPYPLAEDLSGPSPLVPVTENSHMDSLPEPWMRGPIAGVDSLLAPVLYTFQQAREDLHRWTEGLSTGQLWAAPYGFGSVGFHMRHIAGSTGRLMSYLQGKPLNAGQLATLEAEHDPAGAGRDELLALIGAAFDDAETVVRALDPASLRDSRGVGRQQLPTTVIGLLFHIAEHTQRHVGQAISAAKLAAV